MTLIWATRGRSWGFRFLLDGGLSDPLVAYDTAFEGVWDEPAAWRRHGDTVALRFPDPLGRQDAAGRVIPHEFVISGLLAAGIDSVESGQEVIWPMVADQYERVWEQPTPLPPAG